MTFTKDSVEIAIITMFRRADAARAAGGISERERVNGAHIPDGWKIDYATKYWLPPNVKLL
jgi:hypothetical protein